MREKWVRKGSPRALHSLALMVPLTTAGKATRDTQMKEGITLKVPLINIIPIILSEQLKICLTAFHRMSDTIGP